MKNNHILRQIESLSITELAAQYPFLPEYFEENKWQIAGHEERSFIDFLQQYNEEEIEELALDIEAAPLRLAEFIEQMAAFLGIEQESTVQSLTILPGHHKDGRPETFGELTLYTSQITSIVGPTGSGKSRLLADIEWTAMGDTPTGRHILINGEQPDLKWRYSSNNRLVAQLSQNMNFVMDLSVRDFIELHAKSRMVEDVEGVTKRIIEQANALAGEAFDLSTQVTALSGGQSRALMIADTAILSSSPIVLIDEIENAGIDRKKALELLVRSDKIVLMATHDPLLALMADRRIIISEGGISQVLEVTEAEKGLLAHLEEMDEEIREVRRRLRYGEALVSPQK
ncbi:MAG: ATP-binding cassette domain-containing protein [Eubacteriales bacterium]|nr:ATP-binding cassette domain-containing protein [Eubacteriales bacterium]